MKKVISFICLNFLFLNAHAKKVACDFPNYLIQCRSGSVCSPNKCPEDSSNYSNEGRGANQQSSSNSNVTPTATAKKSSSSQKKSKDEPPDQSTGTRQQANCSEMQFPNGYGGCNPCSGNQTVNVRGQVYCGVTDAPESNSDSAGSSYCAEQDTSDKCTEKRNQSYDCIEQFNKMNDKCTSEAASAITSCNDNNEEMQVAEKTAKMIGAGSTTSMQLACSKIGELSKLANGAFSGWKTLCSANQGGCTESCTEAKRLLDIECIEQAPKEALRSTYYNQISENINQCESYKQKIAEAVQHAAAALAQLKASEQCKEDTSSLSTNVVDQCKLNPNSPLCKDLQKCSDANFAALNPVCACAANPTSPSCLQSSAKYGDGKTSGATLSGVNGGKNTFGFPGLGAEAEKNSMSNAIAGVDGQSVGGRQGDASSAGNVSSGSGRNANGSNNSGSGSGHEKGSSLKVNSGNYGGVVVNYLGNKEKYGGTNPAGLKNKERRFSKFDPRKYITGLGGKGEYINGANENIFKIIKCDTKMLKQVCFLKPLI